MMEYLSQALHADPLPALQSAIRAAGPLVRMQSRKNGGKVTPVPIALGPDQSRRRGIMAIIEASKKRSDKKVSIRLAREVVAVIEGNSSTLARKEEIHRFAMVNRSNINSRM
jgi:small subunit ribosomal protein S7